MADKSNLKFYLTASEPNLLQVKSAQSIGGYASATEYNPSLLLTEPLDLVTDSILVEGTSVVPFAVVVDEEVMTVDETVNLDDEYGSSELFNVNRGALSTNVRFHSVGDLVYSAQKNDFFTGSLSSDGKQYRCIAVKNNSLDTYYNLQFYIKNPSLNPNSLVQIGLETPTQGVIYGTSTGGTTISVINTALIGAYADNYFNGRLLVIGDPSSNNVGQARVVASFDSRTGIITFLNSMPFPITTNTQYRIEQPQSQRLLSGRITPILTANNTVAFSSAIGIQNAVGINPNGVRSSGTNLAPYETVYLWFKRDVSANTDKYTNNRVIFTAVYQNS